MNVLVYLEPAVFRGDPSFLTPWAAWTARIANSNPTLRWTCASNRALAIRTAELSRASRVEPLVLMQHDVVGSFDFDRAAYAEDLFASESLPVANVRLFEALERVASDVRPDVVLSFSHNRYIRRVFGPRVVFAELGPFSRALCPESFFFDPMGHHAPNVLSNSWSTIAARVPTEAVQDSLRRIWAECVDRPTRDDPRSVALGRHLESRRNGRKLVLFALQPEDWLTFEGLHPRRSLGDLAMSWTERLPDGFAAVLTYHPSQRINASLERLIADENDAVIVLPDDLSSGIAEFALPHVDAVATISSSVGMQAVLHGKPVASLGRTSFSPASVSDLRDLDRATPIPESERIALLDFLTRSYCHPASRVLDELGYFSRHLERLARSDLASESFVESVPWSEERVRSILDPRLPPTTAMTIRPPDPSPATIRVFVGTDDTQVVAHQVLEYSIRKHSSRRVEFTPMRNLPVPVPRDPMKRPRTGFSFARFLIPRLTGYRGRAIYLDADMLVVSDIAELFDTAFEGRSLLCTNQRSAPEAWRDNPHFHPGPHFAVMLLDCERVRWDIDQIVSELDDSDLSYADLMSRMAIVPRDEIGDFLPTEWNSLEQFTRGTTKLIHYTVVPTQPWVSEDNPNERVWLRYYRDAIRAGFVDPEDVRTGIALGHLSARLGAILDEELALDPTVGKRRRDGDLGATLEVWDDERAELRHDLANAIDERDALRARTEPTNYVRYIASRIDRKTRKSFARLRRKVLGR